MAVARGGLLANRFWCLAWAPHRCGWGLRAVDARGGSARLTRGGCPRCRCYPCRRKTAGGGGWARAAAAAAAWRAWAAMAASDGAATVPAPPNLSAPYSLLGLTRRQLPQ